MPEQVILLFAEVLSLYFIEINLEQRNLCGFKRINTSEIWFTIVYQIKIGIWKILK